jgi:hypothetical protein
MSRQYLALVFPFRASAHENPAQHISRASFSIGAILFTRPPPEENT